VTLKELQAATVGDLIQSDDVNADALRRGLQYAHRQVQRSLRGPEYRDLDLELNWRCMEYRRADLAYATTATTGITIESATNAGDLKTLRKVWLQDSSATADLQPLNPSSEDAAAQDWRRTGGTVWYEARQKLMLAPVPTIALTLTVDFYRYLPFYLDEDGEVDTALSDWFSINIPDVLTHGAAYHLCTHLLQDNRAEKFKASFIQLLLSEFKSDQRSKQGALAKSYSPQRAQDIPRRY